MSPGVWCQLTSIGKIGLYAYTIPEEQSEQQQQQQINLDSILLNQIKLKNVLPNEKWPFMTDYQQEVSSKGLIKLFTDIRTEINKVNLNLLELKYGDKQNEINNKIKL